MNFFIGVYIYRQQFTQECLQHKVQGACTCTLYMCEPNTPFLCVYSMYLAYQITL